MDQWIISLLDRFGAVGVGVLMLIENVFPPLPSEVIMPWAGYSASQGELSFMAVVAWGSLGSFLGASFWYYVARWIGKDRLSQWIEGHGAWLTITPRDLERVDKWFERWGATAVFVCRMIPGLRTLISIPAGFSLMPMAPFHAYTALGTIAWTALLAAVGWWLGDNYRDLAGPLGWVSSLVVAGLMAWWIARLFKQHFNGRHVQHDV